MSVREVTTTTSSTANSLPELLLEICGWLTAARRDRNHPMHIAALATINGQACPKLRSVVLRGVSDSLRELTFHTDRRSGKYTELTANPQCALLFYAPEAKVQIRIEGNAVLHNQDALAREAWADASRMAKDCYRVLPGPGTVIGSHANLTREADEANAYQHFCRVVVNIQAIEWLWLAAAGHRRARFVWAEEAWSGVWLVP